MFFRILIFAACSTLAVHGRCNLTAEPLEIIDCLSYMSRMVLALAKNDISRVCRTTATIAECAQGHLAECIGQQIGDAIFKEIISISTNCCPERNNVNCSIRDAAINEQQCFSADSFVSLPDGNYKPIHQLRSGDAVLAFDHTTKKIVSTQIITMLDFQPQRFAIFKHVETANGRQLSLTPSHLIFTSTHDFIMAKDVQNGMEILVMNRDGQLVTDKVSNVSDVVKQGYLAPLTDEGTLLVNEVAASCYGTISSHRVAHAVLAPMRWWYSLFGMGVEHVETVEGMHWFPKMLLEMTAQMIPSIIQKS